LSGRQNFHGNAIALQNRLKLSHFADVQRGGVFEPTDRLRLAVRAGRQ
jgi:hypothetical protein